MARQEHSEKPSIYNPNNNTCKGAGRARLQPPIHAEMTPYGFNCIFFRPTTNNCGAPQLSRRPEVACPVFLYLSGKERKDPEKIVCETTFGLLTIDKETRIAKTPLSEEPTRLGKREYIVAAHLATHQGEFFSTAELCRILEAELGQDISRSTISPLVASLRTQLQDENRELIIGIQGQGFRIEKPTEDN